MKNRNSKICLFALIMLLGSYNGVMAQDNDIYSSFQQGEYEKVKVNKDTLTKAQEAMDSKDYTNAIKYLNDYIVSKPKKYEAYKMRGDSYYAIRRYDLAQKDYRSAIDIKSSDDKLMTGTKYVSAILLGADKNEQLQNTELGNLYAALMYAQKAQNDPAYATSYENAIKYNSHIYLPQPNKADINKINCPQKYGKELHPKGIDEKVYGAINDIEKQNYNEALYKLVNVTAQYPAYYLGHYLTGVALSGLDKDDDAIKSFEKAVMLNPYDFESYASLGKIYYSKAETTFNNEYTKKSVQNFNKALSLNKDCPTYYFYLGMNELQNGNTNSAISNFDKALKINPNDYNSQYYKLIAQYIKSDYQNVADGATKLLYKHVSNYNSVLYLRALAYSKLNENEKALADLNSIENNIEDIYNQDIKTITPKDKSLESYIHYLKAQIEHEQGLGASSDVNKAYTNPIVNRLAYAQKAMEPYQKSLEGETISPDDYKKFENFYSTALPKLLESGAVINYDDIDNQYDFIRTTFDDLGISFIYTDPDYKITTIKDYPYKKYASKLPQGSLISEPTLSNNYAQTTSAPTMRLQTPQTEMLIQNGETSLAQMLASNALEKRAQNTPFDPTKQKQAVSSAETVKLRDDIQKAEFKPETPPAEKVNTSSNIASGETHITKEPLIDKTNSQKVQNILEEEKNMEPKGMVFKADKIVQTPDIIIKNEEQKVTAPPAPKTEEIKTAEDGTVKITAKEIKQTPDIVIKHDKQDIAQIVEEKTTAQTAQTKPETEETIKKDEPIKITAKEIKETKDVKITYPPAANAAKAVETITSPYTKTETAATIATADTNQNPKAQAAKVLDKTGKSIAAAIAAEETAKIAKPQIKTIPATSNKTDKTIATTKIAEIAKPEVKAASTSVPKVENTIAEAIAAKETASNIIEKHANIAPSDFGVQSTKLPKIENFDDVVELDSNSFTKKFGNYDSDLFIPDRMGFAVGSNQQKTEPQTQTQTEVKAPAPVIRTEETAIEQPKSEEKDIAPAVTLEEPQQSEQPQTTEPQKAAETVKAPVVIVPEITAPETENTSADKTVIREKLAEILEDNLPEQKTDERIITETAQTAAQTTEKAEQKAEDAINTAQQLKAERLRLKEEAKLRKEQLKAEADAKKAQLKAEKLKAKEEAKLQKSQAKEEAAKQKAILKQEALAKKEELKAQKLKAKEEAKLQKEQEKLALAQMQDNANGAKHVIKQSAKDAENEIEQTEQQAQKEATKLKAKIEKEQIAQEKKAQKQQAALAEKAAKEQAKADAETDELKVQLLQAKEEAKAKKETTKAQQDALKQQLKEERAKAQQEYKEKQAQKRAEKKAQKAAQKAEKAAQKADPDYKIMQEQKREEQRAEKAALKAQKAEQKAEEHALKLVKRAEKKQEKAEQKALKNASNTKEKFSFKNAFKKLKFWKKK